MKKDGNDDWNGSWLDVECSEELRYICKSPKGKDSSQWLSMVLFAAAFCIRVRRRRNKNREVGLVTPPACVEPESKELLTDFTDFYRTPTISITCHVYGDSLSGLVLWYKDGEILSGTSYRMDEIESGRVHKLTILTGMMSSGEYRCEAEDLRIGRLSIDVQGIVRFDNEDIQAISYISRIT